jgi:hypothetical protein
MKTNRDWIQLKRSQGYAVYDVGPDFRRRHKRAEQGIRPDSRFYNMERIETKTYGNYIRLFKRSGKHHGGVPGIDF